MKLKHLAALLLRMLGVLLALTGFSEALRGVLAAGEAEAIVEAVGGLVVGGLMIYFSKPLAVMLCRGLDDDAV